MKTIAQIMVYLLFLSSAVAVDKNLLKNGDFEKKKSKWKGAGKVITIENGNKAISVKVHKKRDLAFFQMIKKTRKLKELLISFRYKVTKDFDSLGITMKCTRSDGTFTFRTIEPDDDAKKDWVTYNWPFKEIRRASVLTFSLVVKEGKAGTVYFDDISIIVKQ